MIHCLMFHPNGDIETYAGVHIPFAGDYPLGTYRYCANEVSIMYPGWAIVRVSPITESATWRSVDDVPKEIQLLALIHP